ncbi:hypothetical protein LEN26_020454 [Aphanomyces euteiches]|nr:hypothetical protein LEN26_020454 [Aphanomyces euteiches]KAH9108671.1 hypothetical protein AeMF1_016164 [Aphanomyces euteiches]KAH9194477.1 hypothetical protein AeNC1_003554 [Aphanomyces euteiches]
MSHRWEDDEVTRDIVAALQDGTTTVETRVLLKPIFRWAKREPEKAHDYVRWLLVLYTHGDPSRNISVQPTLQADYAINTLITASQRCGKGFEAERAFNFLPEFEFVPDVFAYTALIDVLGRCGQADMALQRYQEMLRSSVEPNIVTFTTVLRVLGMSTTVNARYSLEVLDRAKSQGAVDPSLYTEALDMCAKRLDFDLATEILRLRRDDGITELLVERTIYAMARALRKTSFEIVDKWLDEGLIHAGDKDAWTFKNRADHQSADGKSSTVGLLSYETPSSVRQSVIEQDIQKLMERTTRNVWPTRMDFETLIHQCRKRKWKEEVGLVFDAMRQVSTDGWHHGGLSLPPQPSVAPMPSTYLALIDAYICCGAPDLTWQMYLEMDAVGIPRTQSIVRKYVRGCYLSIKDKLDAANPEEWHLREVVDLALRDGIPFTSRMATSVLRMYGNNHVDGLVMLATLESRDLPNRKLYDELVQACVYANNIPGAIGVWEAFQSSEDAAITTATFERVMLLSCLHQPRLEAALSLLQEHQAARRLVAIPAYVSILREFYVKYTTNGEMNASGLNKSLKVLYERRTLFEEIEDQASILPSLTNSPDIAATTCGLAWSASLHKQLPCAPIMFAQHVHERFTIVRDKQAKTEAETATQAALRLTSDPLLFVLDAILSLPQLDVSLRVQAKFAKQLFALIDDDARVPAAHHVTHCFIHLDSMSMYLVQELEAIFNLVDADADRVAEFCARSCLADHHPEKTLNFVTARPAFFNPSTIELLVPALAEAYAQGVSITLRYVRQSLTYPDAQHVPLSFTRHLAELLDEFPNIDLRPLIREFNLQKEFAHVNLVAAIVPRTFSVPKVDPSIVYWSIPIPRDCIIFVDSPATIELAQRILLASEAVGWDVEWRPDFLSPTEKTKCSIIQLACATHVFICDVLHHMSDAMQSLLETLVMSPSPWKVTFGLKGDMEKMRYSFPDMSCFESVDEWENVVDVQQLMKKNKITSGLTKCCEELLHLPVNKSQQMSDWEVRPLTEEQIIYAATDAYVLLELVKKLHPPLMRLKSAIAMS